MKASPRPAATISQGRCLRLEQQLEGVATPDPSKTVELKLQRPLCRDFDALCWT